MKIDFCVAETDLIKDKFIKWVNATGEIVNVAPHLSGTFVAHRCVFGEYGWVVSDIETGSIVGTGRTRKIAVDNARWRLGEISQDRLEERWSNRIASGVHD